MQDAAVGAVPLVTVVLATYNWATVLPYSIASVLGQTMRDFELLVIGDACTDESEAVVRGIGDARVRWMNRVVNAGHQAGPNNEGLQRARGLWTAYLGHDDLWLPQHLEHLLQAAPDAAGFVHGRQLRIRPGSAPLVAPPRGWTYQPGAWIPPTSLMHHTAHARTLGGWRFPKDTGRLEPEAEFCLRLARQFGPPQLAPAVTSIKLAAAQRRDVYRTRPSHEQAYWTSRILAAADPERAALDATRDSVDAALGTLPAELQGPLPESAAVRHAVRRRIKGLDA